MQMPFIVMSATQAARFREETAGDVFGLTPRMVDAGPFKGKYVLREELIFKEEYAERRDALRMLPVEIIETTTAWPPVDEPEE